MPVRHDSESADLCPTAVSERRHSTSRSLVRDETYYLADGSCVLLVEETLFNVRILDHAVTITSLTFLTIRFIALPCQKIHHRLVRCLVSLKALFGQKVYLILPL